MTVRSFFSSRQPDESPPFPSRHEQTHTTPEDRVLLLAERYLLQLPGDRGVEKVNQWLKGCAQIADTTSVLHRISLAYFHGDTRLPKDDVQAEKWCRKAAEAGHASAMRNLADRYIKGLGVPRDIKEAAEWYRKAAEAGHVEAMCCLAWLCQTGLGVPEDTIEAERWFRKAAEQGNEVAIESLGAIKTMNIDGK